MSLEAAAEPLTFCGTSLQSAAIQIFQQLQSYECRWQELVRAVDPDVMIGYNILNFDFPYLVTRANTLKLPKFMHWGRIRATPLQMRDAQFSSKAYGTHAYKDISIEGARAVRPAHRHPARPQAQQLLPQQRLLALSRCVLNNCSCDFAKPSRCESAFRRGALSGV